MNWNVHPQTGRRLSCIVHTLRKDLCILSHCVADLQVFENHQFEVTKSAWCSQPLDVSNSALFHLLEWNFKHEVDKFPRTVPQLVLSDATDWPDPNGSSGRIISSFLNVVVVEHLGVAV